MTTPTNNGIDDTTMSKNLDMDWNDFMNGSAMNLDFDANKLFEDISSPLPSPKILPTGEQTSNQPMTAIGLHNHHDAQAPPPPFSNTTQPTPALGSAPDASFWNGSNLMTRSTGEAVHGTNRELWAQYADLRPRMMDLWRGVEAARVQQAQGYQHPAPMQNHAPAQAYQYPDPTANPQHQQLQQWSFPQQTPAMTTGSSSPAPSNFYHTFSAIPSTAPSTPASLAPATAKKRKREAGTGPLITLPPYVPSLDLNDPAAARAYLSRFDTTEAQPLNLPHDDVEHVRTNLHTYAAAVYAALLHPYDQNPPQLQGFDDRREMYVSQQESALANLQKMLQTSAQLKTAKACAILLVDAAVTVHTSGVSLARYEKHTHTQTHGLKADDAYRLNLSLPCSSRVEAMVEAVKGNKLVAKDVLEQKNLLRFAECPDAYVGRKMAYLRSNKTRQDKVDVMAKAGQEGGRVRKRGRRGKWVQEDEDVDFVG